MNSKPSLNSNQPSSTSPNQNQPGNASRISLREALLQQITPTQAAEAEAGALATLSPQPEDASPRPRYSSHSEALDPESSEPSQELERHSRKCTICHHDDRAEIEKSFLHWVSLRDIAFDFRLPSSDAIRRHAIAIGLDDLRARTMRRSLYRIIENAGNAPPTAAGVIRAIRACSFLDDNGRWAEPPRRSIITHEVRPIAPTPEVHNEHDF